MTSDLLGQFVQPVLLENHFVYINDLVNIVAAGFALFNSKQLAGLPINLFPAHSQGISYSRVTALLEEEFAITIRRCFSRRYQDTLLLLFASGRSGTRNEISRNL